MVLRGHPLGPFLRCRDLVQWCKWEVTISLSLHHVGLRDQFRVISSAGGWCSCACKPSTGNVTKCRPAVKAERQRAQTINVTRGLEEQYFSPKVPRTKWRWRALWESVWPFLSVFDVIRVRVTAENFNDAKKYGRHAELFFFLLQNMPDHIELGHVSTGRAIFLISFTRLADTRLPARSDPLCQGALEDIHWLCEWPVWPRGRPRVLNTCRACTHQSLGTHRTNVDSLSLSEGVSHSYCISPMTVTYFSRRDVQEYHYNLTSTTLSAHDTSKAGDRTDSNGTETVAVAVTRCWLRSLGKRGPSCAAVTSSSGVNGR